MGNGITSSNRVVDDIVDTLIYLRILTTKSSPEEKVKFFLSLFRGREDIYAVRWEGRNGKAGYSPACRWVWGKPFPGLRVLVWVISE